jgi:hypothetical protein
MELRVFARSMYQLTDLWVAADDASQHARFIENLRDRISANGQLRGLTARARPGRSSALPSRFPSCIDSVWASCMGAQGA